jgi:rod shape-determining protein MreD
MKDKINYYIFLPLLFFLFFLELTFSARLFASYFPPPLVFIALTAGIFLSNSADFIYLAFFFGAITDVFSGGSFGLYTTTFVVAALAVFFLKVKLSPEDNFIKALTLGAGSILIYDLVYLGLYFVLSMGAAGLSSGLVMQKLFADMLSGFLLVRPLMLLIYKRQI